MIVLRLACLGLIVCMLGCLPHGMEACADGTTCEPGQICAPVGGCSTEALVAACDGAAEGSACEVEDGDSVRTGTCEDGVCNFITCGNGTLDVGEFCDDGNTVDGDSCPGDCSGGGASVCGDGVVQPGETCDEPIGSSDAPDFEGCRTFCLTAGCGDGILDVGHGEECDLAFSNSNVPDSACRPTCLPPSCGDQIVDPARGEACDDGNDVSGDDCQEDCAVPTCGDATIDLDLGEVCDGGVACAGDCLTSSTCGNGAPDAGEGCDDGNNVSGDGCQAHCQEPRCGDHFVDAGEECDDGNLEDDDSCLGNCTDP